MSVSKYAASRTVPRVDESGIPEHVEIERRDEVVMEAGSVVSTRRARMLGVASRKSCERFDEDLITGLQGSVGDGRTQGRSNYDIAHVNPGSRGRPLG